MSTSVAPCLREEEPSTKEPAEMKTRARNGPVRYYVEVLGKALDVLDVLQNPRTELRLTSIAEKANLDISTTFRLLRTLEARGYVQRDKKTKKFKHNLGYRAYRIGYAQVDGGQSFSRKVTQGLMDAAEQARVELLVIDNRYSPEEAVKNAAWLISQKVDFIIEFEFHYRIAPVLATMFSQARIPTLTIDIALPDAIYFGVDNYAAGIVGGEALARFAKESRRGHLDHIRVLDLYETGTFAQLRVTGTLDGMLSVLPQLNEKRVLHKDTKGAEMGGYWSTGRALRSLAKREHLLIAAANDNCARGAIRAVREARREQFAAIMAQGWGPDEALEEELGKADSPLIGAVAYFPEKYGSKILPVVLQCLNGQAVPPALYTEHKLILRDRIQSSWAGRLPTESASTDRTQPYFQERH